MKHNELQDHFLTPEENVDPRGRPRLRKTLRKGAVPKLHPTPSKPARKEPVVRARSPVPIVENVDVPEEPSNPIPITLDHGYAKSSTPKPGPSRFEGTLPAPPSPTLNPLGENNEDVIQNYVKRIEALEADLKYKDKIVTALLRLVEPEQLQKMTGERLRINYSDKAMERSLKMRYLCGTTGYSHLIDLGWPLPSIDALNERIKIMDTNPGLNMDSLKLLGMKSRKMTDNQKEVCLVVDQMSIQQRIEWDPSKKRMSGYINMPRACDPVPDDIDSDDKPLEDNFSSKVLANQSNVYMLAGIQDRHKTPVCYDLSTGSMNPVAQANRVRRIVRLARQVADIRVSSLSMDFGSCNQAT